MYVIIVVLLKFNEIINTTLSLTEVILSREKPFLCFAREDYFFYPVSSGSEVKAAVPSITP